jgi:hypothetical protein
MSLFLSTFSIIFMRIKSSLLIARVLIKHLCHYKIIGAKICLHESYDYELMHSRIQAFFFPSKQNFYRRTRQMRGCSVIKLGPSAEKQHNVSKENKSH